LNIIIIILINTIIGDWGFGDWGLGPIPNPQSPIPYFQAICNIIVIKIYTKN